MAYTTHTVSSMADLLGHIVSAATTAGWANPAANTITLPGGMTCVLSATDGTFDKTLRLEDSTDPTRYTEFRAPYINGVATGQPDTPTPTKLSLFTGTAPDHYIAGVVEFGFNSYRHFYFGHMDKIGNYGSLGLLSSNQFNYGYGDTTLPTWDYSSNRNLFGSRCQSATLRADAGGMDITHIDRTDPDWARFGAVVSSINAHSGLDGNEIIGGSLDGINTVDTFQGKSAFAGQNILVPPNLYITEGAGASVRYRPLGKPHGVRFVNLEGLDTDSSITVGADTWRVFAEFRRSSNTVGVRDDTAPNRYIDAELSYHLGIAYLEN